MLLCFNLLRELFILECLPDYDLIVPKINCTFPEVLNKTILTENGLECASYECICADHDAMATSSCLEPEVCTSPGCHIQKYEKCDCVINSTCGKFIC